jgi:hypothetical protein
MVLADPIHIHTAAIRKLRLFQHLLNALNTQLALRTRGI